MAAESTSATVLLVDDEPELLDLYAAWLDGWCTVRTASDGETALERVDGEVDVAFLDRRMPGLPGEDVLREFRSRGYDCRVAMLTAVEPRTDVVEMPFDDYVVKPVDGDELRSVTDVLLQRATYERKSQELFALASKKAALEASGEVDHATSPEYRKLTERLDALQAEVDDALSDLIEQDYSAAFNEIEA
ncbi:MAG: response regulator transcription factor [Haloferacaceae archaeon]